MADVPTSTPGDPEGFKERRENRDHLLRWLTFLTGLIPVITSALGFSPLTNIWSLLGVVIAAILVLILVSLHHNDKRIFGKGGVRGAAAAGKLALPLPRGQRILQTAAFIAVIFGAGAWVGSSGRNAFLLAAYGTLGDLAISPGSDMVSPAAIQLRKDGGLVCFFTTATFNVRNARSDDVQIGLISNSLSLADDTNSPIYPAHPSNDVTQTGGNVSGVRLITGSVNDYLKTIDTIKDHLTTFQRGENKDITVVQNRFWNETCLPDPDGKVAQGYKGSVVKISGELVMVLPDGTWRQESFGLTEPAKVSK